MTEDTQQTNDNIVEDELAPGLDFDTMRRLASGLQAKKHTRLLPGQMLQLGDDVYYVRKITAKDVIIRRVRRDQAHRIQKVDE